MKIAFPCTTTYIGLSLGMTLCMAALSFCMYLKSVGYDHELLLWVPLVAVIIYMLGFCVGVGPMQWIYLGELLPHDVKVRVTS